MRKLVVVVTLLCGTMVLASQGAPSLAGPSDEVPISRDECIRQVANFMAQFEIREDARKLYDYVRPDYDRDDYAILKRDHYEDGCRYLHEQVKSLETNVPCYYNDTIMGANETQNVKDVMRANEGAKYVVEVEYACFYYVNAGSIMRQHGIYEAIMDRP